MGSLTTIILALAAVDAIIIAAYHLWLRSTPPMDARRLAATGAGLLMFAVHALFFLEGAILFIQLANLGILFYLSWLRFMGNISKASTSAASDS